MQKKFSIAKIKVGTRSSPLALAQVEEILVLLARKGIKTFFERKIYNPKGDRDKTTPLTQNTADDFFTDALDEALLKGEVDIAIHSAKDLPQAMNDDLEIFAITKSLDETDAFVGKVKFNELKTGAKVGTSSILRQKSLKELNPALQCVDIRGTIQERLQLVEKGLCDGVIAATAALKRLGLDHFIKDIMPWEGTPLQGSLAVVGKRNKEDLKKIFARIDIREKFGKVYLVGAGPGDPGLITLKGLAILKKADCIFYDYLAPGEILKHAPRAQKVYVGKRKGEHTLPQSELNKLIRQKVTQGKTVVRLKGGDPLIFGRGADEIEYLRAYHIDVEIIPGVSSATGLASLLGIPLTARGISSSVAFLSGYEHGEKDGEMKLPAIPQVDTIVFLMGLTKLKEIILSLKNNNWKETTPILIISKGTYPDEKVVAGNLRDIEKKVSEERLEPPALIIAGEVVRFYKSRHKEKNILYTGTNPEKYKRLGAIIHLPMIKIRKAKLGAEKQQKLFHELAFSDVILLTSRFGVHYFFKLLQKKKYNITLLKSKQWIVIGAETAAALHQHGIEPAFVANEESSEGLVKELKERFPLRDKKILFPRSSLPNPYLKEKLTALGNRVEEVTVYENVKPPKRKLPEDGITQVIFTSPSTVRNFLKDYKRIPSHWKVLSKGTFTQRTLSEFGYQSEVIQ